jgi:hypothetical protein
VIWWCVCVCGEEPSRGTLYRVTRRLAPISSGGDEAMRPGSDRPLGQGASIGAMKEAETSISSQQIAGLRQGLN